MLLLEIVLDLTLKSIFILDMRPSQRIILASIKPLLCVFILFSEFEVLLATRTSANEGALKRALEERERQYQIRHDTIEAINVKVHDIKHQIRSLADGTRSIDGAALEDLAHAVNVYGAEMRTGNEALDTLLTEKSLECERDHITLTCMADGHILDFMPTAELYAFFGNALDNAIEAVRRLPEQQHRSISLTVEERSGMAMIHMENYFAGTVSFTDEGLPLTKTGDTLNHGFGTRSMKLIAERHDGVFNVGAHGDVFYINALIPLEPGTRTA